MKDGGYDIGYKKSKNFWGTKPGSLVLQLEKIVENFNGKRVLDLGCGEGKNSFYLAGKGCTVEAYDVSEYSISNAANLFGENKNVIIEQRDVLDLEILEEKYDIIIAYGLFHCFENFGQVENVILKCLNGLKKGGFFILCAFNSRKQDLSAHENFNPILLTHEQYLSFFKENNVIFNTDEDLFETHPHNNIPHSHSMTRLIINK